jgi:hypothetical protein
MAFYGMEPWGSHYDDLRTGTVASMLANINRDTKVQREPFGALDFIPWNEHHQLGQAEAKPVLLDDLDKHAELVLSTMFPNRDG